MSIVCTLIAIWCIAQYFALTRLAIVNNSTVLPDVTLPVTAITCLLGSILSYLIYQGSLKMSLNKNGLCVDSISGVITAIKSADVPQVIESAVKNAANKEHNEEYEPPIESVGEKECGQESYSSYR